MTYKSKKITMQRLIGRKESWQNLCRCDKDSEEGGADPEWVGWERKPEGHTQDES